jgi:hypothetical protein
MMLLTLIKILGPAFLLLEMAGSSLALEAQEHTKSMAEVRAQMRAPLSAEQTFRLRAQIVRARYDEDLRLLRTKSRSGSMEEILRQLQGGDILLVRTTSLAGSIAARSAEVPGQFSHLILIAEDPATHELKAIQSDQSKGLSVNKVELPLFAEYVRMGLFRYAQPGLAKAAAGKTLAKVRSRLRTGPIRYDNKMDIEDSSAIYCTEVATWAFSTVGLRVPARLSKVRFLSTSLREELGIDTDEVFTPQDLEVDRRFTLVQEWRDLSRLQELYQADAIFGKYFTWLADGTEQLHPGFVNNLAVSAVGSVFAGKIASRIGENPGDSQRVTQLMKYSLSMYATVSTYKAALQKELRFVDTRFFKEVDYEEILERLRRENRLQWQVDPADDVYYGR